jgi:hypothetical protein
VLSILHRKAYTVLALLLVCMTAIMVMECQVHTSGAAHEHATPSHHHHSHDASRSTAGAVPCLLAVLPLGVEFGVFIYVWFRITLRMLHGTSPVFPLFIPPRSALRASRTSSRRSVLCVVAIR